MSGKFLVTSQIILAASFDMKQIFDAKKGLGLTSTRCLAVWNVCEILGTGRNQAFVRGTLKNSSQVRGKLVRGLKYAKLRNFEFGSTCGAVLLFVYSVPC